MSRVIQLRRGTTNAHSTFTGLIGEVTYDTDAQTLRVHDGQTLGGIALARRDEIPAPTTTPEFDINSVPPAFWQNIVQTYVPNIPQIHQSRLIPVTNTSYLEYAWDMARPALAACATMVCQTPEADYSVGDAVAAFGIGGNANPRPITFTSGTTMHVRLPIGGGTFWVCHKNTGVRTNITNDRWKIQFSIWY